MIRRSASGGQALVELAIVLPVLLLLGTGAVAIVQLARTQMALETSAASTALVAARAPDATAACQEGHAQLMTAVSESRGLLPSDLTDRLGGRCVGALASVQPTGSGAAYAIWLGLGSPGNTFCRRGSLIAAAVTDGDVVVSIAYRPNLSWIPLVGGWMAPVLGARSVQKVDPFRSRDPSQDASGDSC